MDQCRQEIEKSVKILRDYETKVSIMERYIHTMKLEPNGKKEMTKKKKSKPPTQKKEQPELRHQSPSSSGSNGKNSKGSKEDFYSSSSSIKKFEKEFEVNLIIVFLISLKIDQFLAFEPERVTINK